MVTAPRMSPFALTVDIMHHDSTKVRYSITKAMRVAFMMTFLSIFDVPYVGRGYFFIGSFIFIIGMRYRIQHMFKHKYAPFSMGKKRYGGKKAKSSNGNKKASTSSSSFFSFPGRDCLV